VHYELGVLYYKPIYYMYKVYFTICEFSQLYYQ
jgi:hypothetical protein